MAEGRNLVGVDIGASSVKVVQLREQKKRYTVVKFAYAPLPPQTIVDGHVMSAGAVTETLMRIFTDGKISQRDVAVGLYGQSVIVRKITVPLMTPEELEEQIVWEAEQHIPFDIKVMSVDYEVLKRRPEASQMDLLLVAAKKDEINDFTNIIKEAKLRPVVVDINAFTVQNVFELAQGGLPQEGTFALLNIGAAVSSLNVISKGTSAFTREITNAGNFVTDEIQKRLSVSFEQAESYKIAAAMPHSVPQPVVAAIQQACESLAGEIQRSLDFYLATSGEQEISRIHLCGGCAYLTPLAAAIERRAKVPVGVFDPLSTITIDSKTVAETELRARAAQAVVALGLGLRTDRERRA